MALTLDNGLHFISGLPRSGSTLLAGILRQNPRFHAAMTGPVGYIFMSMQTAVSRKNETALFLDDDQKRALLKGIFANAYHAIHPHKVVIDTNRLWCSKLPVLAELFPRAKMICCVRNISWIMDSIERIVRRNPFELSGMFGFDAGGTVFSRVNRLASSDGMVGFALDALKEAFFGEQADRLILVDYEALVRAPAATLARLYDFLGEPAFVHDFDQVEYDAQDYDLALGTAGLHTVRRKIAWIDRQTVLPPELFARFGNDAFWTHTASNVRNVPVVLPPGPAR
jgi:sulfotransferase